MSKKDSSGEGQRERSGEKNMHTCTSIDMQTNITLEKGVEREMRVCMREGVRKSKMNGITRQLDQKHLVPVP